MLHSERRPSASCHYQKLWGGDCERSRNSEEARNAGDSGEGLRWRVAKCGGSDGVHRLAEPLFKWRSNSLVRCMRKAGGGRSINVSDAIQR